MLVIFIYAREIEVNNDATVSADGSTGFAGGGGGSLAIFTESMSTFSNKTLSLSAKGGDGNFENLNKGGVGSGGFIKALICDDPFNVLPLENINNGLNFTNGDIIGATDGNSDTLASNDEKEKFCGRH